MADAEERDRIEGRYTQAQPETAGPRDVHGQYTESEGHPGPEGDIVGAYVGSERDGEEPLVRSSQLRSGNYPKAEHEDVEHHRAHADHGDPEHRHGARAHLHRQSDDPGPDSGH